jgi:hypothetical protein
LRERIFFHDYVRISNYPNDIDYNTYKQNQVFNILTSEHITLPSPLAIIINEYLDDPNELNNSDTDLAPSLLNIDNAAKKNMPQ